MRTSGHLRGIPPQCLQVAMYISALQFACLHNIFYYTISQCVRTVTSGFVVGLQLMKVVWRFVTTMPGAPCVMTSGEYQMPMLPVDNSVSLASVCLKLHHSILLNSHK